MCFKVKSILLLTFDSTTLCCFLFFLMYGLRLLLTSSVYSLGFWPFRLYLSLYSSLSCFYPLVSSWLSRLSRSASCFFVFSVLSLWASGSNLYLNHLLVVFQTAQFETSKTFLLIMRILYPMFFYLKKEYSLKIQRYCLNSQADFYFIWYYQISLMEKLHQESSYRHID